MPTESDKAVKKERKPHKKLWAIIIIVLVLVIGASVFLFFIMPSQEEEPAEFSEPEAGMEETALYQALLENGIEDAVAEFQEKQVLVSFELPQGLDEQKTAYFVLGLAGGMAEPSQEVIVEIFSGNTSKIYSVKAETIQKLAAKEISENEFETAVKIK